MSSQRSLAVPLLLAQAALSLLLAVALGLRHVGMQLTLLAALTALMSGAVAMVLRRELAARTRFATQPEPALASTRAETDSLLPHQQELEYVARLAGGVARNFNNLLTVIGASNSLAERALSRGACPSAELEEVRDAVERASQLTRQLSAFARRRLPLKRE